MDAPLLQAAISAKLKNSIDRLCSKSAVRPAPDARLDSGCAFELVGRSTWGARKGARHRGRTAAA